MFYRAELHVHTVLSPCADVEMIPPLIVREALDRGISILGITDHNTTGNAQAVMRAAAGTGLAVYPGMELQTKEEVHLLCLFASLDQALAWSAIVDSHLPPLQNKPDFFGEQFLVDDTGDYLGTETRLLLVSADINFDEAVRGVQNLGGLAIPAHVDRKAFGLFANLGFLPQATLVDGIEISRHISPHASIQAYPQLKDFSILQGGDAHRLEELIGLNEFEIEATTFSEIRLALARAGNRKINIRPV